MPTISAHVIVARQIDSVQERSVGEARSTICEGCDSEHRKVSVHNPKVPPTEAKIQQVFCGDFSETKLSTITKFSISFYKKKSSLINNCTGS